MKSYVQGQLANLFFPLMKRKRHKGAYYLYIFWYINSECGLFQIPQDVMKPLALELEKTRILVEYPYINKMFLYYVNDFQSIHLSVCCGGGKTSNQRNTPLHFITKYHFK